MADTPDFDQLARAFMENATDHGSGSVFGHSVTLALAEQLRQVWNARGVADLAILGTVELEGPPELDTDITRTIKSLDR
jgi:hypothetical protein